MYEKYKKKWREDNIVAHQGPNPLEHSANTTWNIIKATGVYDQKGNKKRIM